MECAAGLADANGQATTASEKIDHPQPSPCRCVWRTGRAAKKPLIRLVGSQCSLRSVNVGRNERVQGRACRKLQATDDIAVPRHEGLEYAALESRATPRTAVRSTVLGVQKTLRGFCRNRHTARLAVRPDGSRPGARLRKCAAKPDRA